MNKNLIDAAQALLDSLMPWHLSASPYRELAAAVEEAKNEKPPQVIVFVQGGVVTSVMGMDGKEYPCSRVVDYDNQDDGNCPVCGTSDIWTSDPCPECGYFDDIHQGTDNALECAIEMIRESEE